MLLFNCVKNQQTLSKIAESFRTKMMIKLERNCFAPLEFKT